MSAELWSALGPAVANHIWQSSLCVAIAAVLCLTLRHCRAAIRHWIWLVASIKFLVPFSLLSVTGSHIVPPQSAGKAYTDFPLLIMREVGRPFGSAALLHRSGISSAAAFPPPPVSSAHWLAVLLAALWLAGCGVTIFMQWLRWRRLSTVLHTAIPAGNGQVVDALRRIERSVGVRRPIRVMLSPDSALEPGVAGIVRPALIWPARISEHLREGHLHAVLAHEVLHVLRRDNLAAAVHMIVEALFWFHPLVWWLGNRLVDAREAACDEEVLRLGTPPAVYAESILKACEFCLRSPVACVSGVTGADLRGRVRRIMSRDRSHALSFSQKTLLAAVGVAALAAPLAYGMMHPAPAGSHAAQRAAPTPEYTVASIKPDTSGTRMVRILSTPDGFSATNASLQMLICLALDLNNNQLSGIPGWAKSARYDIEAKVDPSEVSALKDLSFAQKRKMVEKLLEDRFGLKLRPETKKMPVYALVVGKSGSRLKETNPGETYPDGLKGPDGKGGAGMMRMGPDGLTGQGVPISNLVRALSNMVGRTVIDRTGLTGKYDFTLSVHDFGMMAPPPQKMDGGPPGQGAETTNEDSGPSIFTAIQDQLGLKLESEKAPLAVYVVEQVEQPSPN